MPNTALLGAATTVVMAVDSTARISLYSGGDKLSEQPIDPLDPPLTVDVLRIGATEPNGLSPGSILLEQASLWTIPLVDQYAQLYSGNLNWTEPVENTPKPVVSIPAALTVKEGDTLQIPVTKSGTGACTVQLRTIGREATTPADYTGFLSPVTFGANDTVINMPLVTIADAAGTDAGDETLRLELSLAGSTDATLGNAFCTVTITEPPRISVPSSASVKEGGVLSLIVSKAGTGACSVQWRTISGTGPTGATVASGDYTGVSATTLNFSASETQKTVTVTTLTDATAEDPETFSILLENPTGCTITTPSCTVTILDPTAPEEPEQTALTAINGFASAADCGLGYQIYTVTNLADSGAGSLRAGCALGKRMIIFEVGGRITLSSHLTVASNTTIAGETAPAPGITIQKKEFKIQSSNVRVSHICFQRGYSGEVSNGEPNGNVDVCKIAEGTGSMIVNGVKVPWEGTPTVSSNIHFQHCAFYWGSDETVQHWPSLSRRIDGVSYHECIFAEPLRWPKTFDSSLINHYKVEKPPIGIGIQSQHNYGVLIGYNTRRVDMQHCLFQDVDMRAPFLDHSMSLVLANMIANNCNKGTTIQQNQKPTHTASLLTVKGYLCISGPNTSVSGAYGGLRWHQYNDLQADNTKVFAEKLYGWRGGPNNTSYKQPDEKVTFANEPTRPYWLNGTTKVPVMVSTPPIDTPVATVALTAQEIYDRAVLNIGPRPKEIRALIAGTTTTGNKDVARTIKYLKGKTGRWPNHEEESYIGGFYAPALVRRTFTATATFPDGTLIGLPPAGSDSPTATTRANQRAWLRKHLDQIQND